MSAEAKRHEQVAEVLRERIRSGELVTRRRIPSQLAMAMEFKSSSRTVSRAVASLRERNYLWTLPHKGSYPRPPEDWPENDE